MDIFEFAMEKERRAEKYYRQLADKAEFVIRIDDDHFGRVEDAQMLICHLLCYSYMDKGHFD